MSFAKWRADDIEETRSQLNELQKRLEEYTGVKRIAKLLLKSVTDSVKSRFTSFLAKKPAGNSVSDDFFAKNPDFKPYQIKVQPVAATAPRQKVLHVIPYFITGGSQQLVVDIIEGLSHRYVHEVALLKVHAEQGYVGVTTHDCAFVKTPTDFEALLHRVKPDIVHVHYYGRWPYVFWHWYHAVFQGALAYGRPVVENCNIPYMPYFDERISKYVYVSEYAQDTFGIRKLPNQVVYPGSNFSFFQRGGTVPDPDTIGMVYRLDDDKLNENAILPFIRAVQLRPATKVLIVGGGKYFNLFQEKVAAAGLQSQFTFTGYVAYEKLADLYRQMAVFVAPVYSESFGQVTPFAMNMAIPVAAYDIGALDEILANPAMLAPSDDADALAAVIVGLLANPALRAEVGAANKARAAQLFAVETMVRSYQGLYEDLLK